VERESLLLIPKKNYTASIANEEIIGIKQDSEIPTTYQAG
jgi:hypothetical protein